MYFGSSIWDFLKGVAVKIVKAAQYTKGCAGTLPLLLLNKGPKLPECTKFCAKI